MRGVFTSSDQTRVRLTTVNTLVLTSRCCYNVCKTHSKLCDFMISKGRIMKPLFTLGEVRFLLPIFFFLILISLYLDFNYFKRYHSSGGSL